jgi:DNA repair photolyase
MSEVEFREVTCKTALNRVQGMPFAWSLNPYRGCAHDCQYCYARGTHSYLDLNGSTQFSRVILVKTNLPEVLARELGRPRWRREEVAIGTATDPYQPIEGRWQLTRRALLQFVRYRSPASIVTKGTMIVRDLDVLQEMMDHSGVTVCVSLPTVDCDTWRRMEPGTAPPEQRLRILRRLVDGGIRAGVLMAPLLPGLSARPEEVERTVHAAADHGAQFIGSGLLHLDFGVRDHYLGFLAREYPELLATYDRLYGLASTRKYASRSYSNAVKRRVSEAKASYGYGDEEHRHVDPPRLDRQLELPVLTAG